jgi:hypothetical protein
MTRQDSKDIAIGIIILLALGATTSPAIAQEDGLSGGQIILVQDQGKGKKKGQKAAPDGTPCATSGVMCAGACRNLATDERNCGSCGLVCALDQACENGVCMAR